ncbi:hypothetical protein [Paenibacillus sp. GP183]|uniref:hypothetical protein n=1 Tax=Paenibacillus sp. GP183 TaxID=1882751 RepID=UPI000895FA18|nr:hypothetical protein [Paenibacillus sp. GP183]SED12663.1 hypothetical protein SAMN05443246_5823 [Paenibacillus sp. GP183]
MRVRVTVLFIFAFIMFFAGIGMFGILYVKGQDLLPKTIVYEPKGAAKIDKFTEITPEKFDALFAPKEILQASVNPTMITISRKHEVMNKVMTQTLHQGDYLSINYIGDAMLTPKEGEKEYPIPSSWWEVLDWTGRNGDIGEVWLFPTDKLKQNLAYKTSGTGATSTTSTIGGSGSNGGTTQLNGQSNVNAIEVPDTKARPLSKPVFEKVRLRYVMDSSNKAVTNVKGVDDRSEGTGKPSDAKIYLKPEQYAVLKTAVQEGYKLIYAADQE